MCENIAVFESMKTAIEMLGEQHIIAEQSDGYGIGDIYKDGKWTKNIPSPQTEEQKQAAYDALSVKYIHEKYSYDEENKIMREYLSDMNNVAYKTEFDAYNAYVQECKQRAYKEIYGNK